MTQFESRSFTSFRMTTPLKGHSAQREWIENPPLSHLQAIANTYGIVTLEYPKSDGLNPMTLWNLHWVKELDDEGFIEKLLEQLSP